MALVRSIFWRRSSDSWSSSPLLAPVRESFLRELSDSVVPKNETLLFRILIELPQCLQP